MTMDRPDALHYGCLFCITGREFRVAEEMGRLFPQLSATALVQEKHKSVGGQKTTERVIMLPGYVFFASADRSLGTQELFRVPGIIRVLRGQERDWPLVGSDRTFAKMVMDLGGVIAMSQAYKEGDRVCVLSGPLKDLEGNITRIDRRSRNGQIELKFDNRTWKVWLAFEYISVTMQDKKDIKIDFKTEL